MAVSQAKENILKKIRQALSHPVSLPFPHGQGTEPVFAPLHDDPAVVFAEQFTALQGRFAFCADHHDLQLQLKHLIQERQWGKIYCAENKLTTALGNIFQPHGELKSCDVSITTCECLVARTGTMVLSAQQQFGRTASVYAPIHVCIAYSDQMMPDLKQALAFLKSKYQNRIPSLITFASGPSRTADIEKTLVTGVHGPREVYCFLVESPAS